MHNGAKLGLGDQDRILAFARALDSEPPFCATGFESGGVRGGNGHVQLTWGPVLLDQPAEGPVIYDGAFIQGDDARAQLLNVAYVVAGEKE